MHRRRKRGVASAAVALVAMAVLGATPASADCVSAEVSYVRPGQTRQYVVGPKQCVAPTPFNEGPIARVPAGEPSLVMFGITIWVAAP